MSSSNYTKINPPIEVQYNPSKNPAKHLEISSRGIIFSSDEEIDIGTILELSIKQITMTGSIDFMGKVLQCQSKDDSFEIHANFYGETHSKENDILQFIAENS